MQIEHYHFAKRCAAALVSETVRSARQGMAAVIPWRDKRRRRGSAGAPEDLVD